jgi:PIN domain nuclease of toxin-antitoxin system
LGFDGGAVVIYLDTHVAVWLYAGQVSLIPLAAQTMIEEQDVTISPMVVLELEYLHEIERLSVSASVIVESLEASLGLRVCTLPFHLLVTEAAAQKWTRDPFDRIIAANAICAKSDLLTKDTTIREHCSYATWG